MVGVFIVLSLSLSFFLAAALALSFLSCSAAALRNLAALLPLPAIASAPGLISSRSLISFLVGVFIVLSLSLSFFLVAASLCISASLCSDAVGFVTGRAALVLPLPGASILEAIAAVFLAVAFLALSLAIASLTTELTLFKVGVSFFSSFFASLTTLEGFSPLPVLDDFISFDLGSGLAARTGFATSPFIFLSLACFEAKSFFDSPNSLSILISFSRRLICAGVAILPSPLSLLINRSCLAAAIRSFSAIRFRLTSAD